MIQPEILCQSPVFRGISPEGLAELFQQIHYQVKSYQKGELIVNSGEICDRLLIVQGGSVKAEMTDYSGKTIKIEDMHAYEVGPEVVEAVEANFSNSPALLKPSMNKGHAFFDLWEANQTALLESGIREENIEVMGLCSFEHADLFYSARREGSDTGRMVSGIRLV